jgi:ABC-type multidrug transport system fused ATPase/permease subunit
MRFSKVFGIWTTLPRALPYVRPYRKLGLLSVLFTVIAAAVALAEPWPLAIMVDSVLGEKEPPGVMKAILGEDAGVYSLLVFVVVLGFLITFLSHGITVLSDWVTAKLEQRMVLDLRSDLFRHCQGLSLTFHDARMTGQLMNQINMQAAAIGAIIVAFPPIFQAVLTLVGMFVVILLIDWQVALVSLVAVPIIWWSLGLYGTKIVPRLQRVQGLEWQSLSIVHEAMAMLRVIVTFGREGHEYKRFREQGETAVEERISLTVRQTLFSLAVTSATAIGTGLVLGFGAWHVIQDKITVGELLVLIAYVAAVYQPLEQVSTTIGELNDQFVQFNSSLDLLDIEPEVKEAPDAIELERARGGIAFEDVSFAYDKRTDTLRAISFAVAPGERVAIVGPTGAGKTTLINLLIRFYDPRSGRILIDGHDIRDLKLHSLRNQISVVLQEPLLFSGTIADNIRYGQLDASDEEIVAAAKGANAHDFIERQPEGYETVLGERGAQLSGGERQRIAVARAFIRDAPILILDEPTSSIDSRTEGVILDALDELMEGRTSFMIAHRLSTVRDADKIIVIQDGEIVEQGSHEELLELGGTYRQLHNAQTRQRRRRRASLERQAARRERARSHARSADGDFDKLGAGADDAGQGPRPETREDAIAAGDFDAFGPGRPQPAVAQGAGAVDLNVANFEMLRDLGMSVTQAIRVLAHRERTGGFSSIEDLEQVPGFPPDMRRQLKRKMTVEREVSGAQTSDER